MKDCIVCNQQTLGHVVCPQCLQKELETIKQNTNSECLNIIYNEISRLNRESRSFQLFGFNIVNNYIDFSEIIDGLFDVFAKRSVINKNDEIVWFALVKGYGSRIGILYINQDTFMCKFSKYKSNSYFDYLINELREKIKWFMGLESMKQYIENSIEIIWSMANNDSNFEYYLEALGILQSKIKAFLDSFDDDTKQED